MFVRIALVCPMRGSECCSRVTLNHGYAFYLLLNIFYQYQEYLLGKDICYVVLLRVVE